MTKQFYFFYMLIIICLICSNCIIFNSMSEVIADMDLGLGPRAPTCLLSQTLQRGIFFNKSFVTYSDTEIKILVRKQLCGGFQLITNITAQKMELSLQSTLLKNGEFYVVNSLSFIKTTFQPTLKILINQQGRIAFKMHTFLATQIQFKHKRQAEKIKGFIQGIYIQMMETFTKVFQKVKFIIQPVYQKHIYQNDDQLEKLDIIKTTCSFMFLKPSFIYTYASRKKTNKLTQQYMSENELQPTKIYDMKVQSYKIPEKEKFKFFVQLWGDSLNLQKVEDTILYKNTTLVQIKHKIKNNIKIPQPKSQRGSEPEQVLCLIDIPNPEKIQWNKIHEGGFGSVYKGNISFFFISQNAKQKKYLHDKAIQRTLAIKTDKSGVSSSTSRIQVQKIILKSMKKKKSRFIPKFYQCKQKIANFSNFLLMEYFPLKSLVHWFANYGYFTSLSSKLMIILFVCYGLYFLHGNNIVHRDLKTSNILIDNRMVTKIVDFGQSYHTDVQLFYKTKTKEKKPGFTLPYCPPQVFSKANGIAQAIKQNNYDMFSLGFIIFEIIFGRPLLQGISQSQLKKLYIKQANKLQQELYQDRPQFIQQPIQIKPEQSSSQKPGKGRQPIMKSICQMPINIPLPQINSSPGKQEKGQYQYDMCRYRSEIKQRLYLTGQELSYYGPSQLLSPIFNIVERCLDPKIQNRPQLQWIINIIRQVYGSFTQFYNI